MIGSRVKVANFKAIKAWKKWHPEEPWQDHTFPFDNDFEYLVCLGSYRKTRVFCSKPRCCGNPRKERGSPHLTLQEKKATISFKEQLQDEMDRV